MSGVPPPLPPPCTPRRARGAAAVRVPTPDRRSRPRWSLRVWRGCRRDRTTPPRYGRCPRRGPVVDPASNPHRRTTFRAPSSRVPHGVPQRGHRGVDPGGVGPGALRHVRLPATAGAERRGDGLDQIAGPETPVLCGAADGDDEGNLVGSGRGEEHDTGIASESPLEIGAELAQVT